MVKTMVYAVKSEDAAGKVETKKIFLANSNAKEYAETMADSTGLHYLVVPTEVY